MNRIFQSTPEGDRVARLLSLLVFSTANGKYKDKAAKIDGAAPPMMIHSKPSSKKDNTSAAERRLIFTMTKMLIHNTLMINIRTD
jgi:hypothetical protein